MPELTIGWSLQACFLVRIIVAAACGMAIGIEREKRLKSAGLRTHMLVAMASALMIIISKYGFLDVVYLSSVQVDASRMAAGVVQAIGFLGAGVIFVKSDGVVGVTTAAGLWATVGIGLAIGAGLYGLGVLVTVLIIVIQLFVHKKEHLTFSTNTGTIMINMTKHGMNLPQVKAKLDEIHVTIRNINMKRNDKNELILKASIVCSRAASLPEIIAEMNKTGFIDGIEVFTVE